jgi:phosphoribosyl-ATP pyrophosphohydrolase/phosphoribosyl-AMP cyclohydrolase
MLDPSELDFSKGNGLVTVVTQDASSGVVLMVAHADREAMERTIATGEMHYHSRTRGLWHKGATSGNWQRVVSLSRDCDGDAVLARVIPAGPACHTGATSCFPTPPAGDALSVLDATIADRAAQAAREDQPHTQQNGVGRPSYTVRLLKDRNLRLKKLGEETAELIAACADGDLDRATEEAADLLYHALVALRAVGGSLSDVQRVLARRASPPAPSTMLRSASAQESDAS